MSTFELNNEYQYLGRSSGVKAQGEDKYYYYYILLYAKLIESTDSKKIGIKVIMTCDADSTFYGFSTAGQLFIVENDGIENLLTKNNGCPNENWADSSSLEVLEESGIVIYPRHVKIIEQEYDVSDSLKTEFILKADWVRYDDGGTQSFLPKADTKISVQATVSISKQEPDEPEAPQKTSSTTVPMYLFMGWSFARYTGNLFGTQDEGLFSFDGFQLISSDDFYFMPINE